MSPHPFLLTPGTWLGEGKIQLSMVEEELPFSMRWNVSQKDAMGSIECAQEVEVQGVNELMHNQFRFFDITPSSFSVELENEALGKVGGKGVIDDKLIAWEIRAASLGFEGFEVYEKQSNGSYAIRGEYATDDQFRTTIMAHVWLQ